MTKFRQINPNQMQLVHNDKVIGIFETDPTGDQPVFTMTTEFTMIINAPPAVTVVRNLNRVDAHTLHIGIAADLLD